jgi:hypothetical protein
MESHGEKLAREIGGKFALPENIINYLAGRIDSAITDALKADSLLRLPPKERKKQAQEEPEKPVQKAIKKAPEPKPIIFIDPRPDKSRTPSRKELAEADEIKLAMTLRREVNSDLMGDYPGRVLTQEMKAKINRLEELEKKYKNILP